MANAKFRTQAEEFLVWREGQNLNWNCTCVSLAAECKLSVSRVDYICRNRGWKLHIEDEVCAESNSGKVFDLVTMMKRNSLDVPESHA